MSAVGVCIEESKHTRVPWEVPESSRQTQSSLPKRRSKTLFARSGNACLSVHSLTNGDRLRSQLVSQSAHDNRLCSRVPEWNFPDPHCVCGVCHDNCALVVHHIADAEDGSNWLFGRSCLYYRQSIGPPAGCVPISEPRDLRLRIFAGSILL